MTHPRFSMCFKITAEECTGGCHGQVKQQRMDPRSGAQQSGRIDPVDVLLTDTGLFGRNKSVVGKEGKNMAHKFSFGAAYQAMIHKLCM